tara:strand:+ start:395 stop:601 length:207 start_codon:yes stop_codon:yes gene_type:complete
MKDTTEKNEVLSCVICKADIEHEVSPTTGKVYWTEGHNAEPVKEGRCCNSCNENVVIPTRLQNMGYVI